MKRRLRNQPGRLPCNDRLSIRIVAGLCPSCTLRCFSSGESTSIQDMLGVIYRRSGHSITFRCRHCSLQWTVTLVNLRRAAVAKAASLKDEFLAHAYSTVLEGTTGVPEREAVRKTAINRQLNRRVIRLPDRTPADNNGANQVICESSVRNPVVRILGAWRSIAASDYERDE
jgi:hypothetical protein